jgi:predicted ATPase
LAEISFGEWLKRRRSALGLKEKLALQLNCSTSALRKFESEARRPSAEIVEQLADIFNIPQEERKSFLRFARGDWQATPSGDTEESPWRVSHVAPHSNLPASTTSFIGREKELAEIENLIAKNRLITLTGAGGIGKTRLSIQTAAALLNDFSNGTWLVELAPLSDAALIPQVIVNTLGLLDQANRSPQTILTDFLQAKKLLLILDNCEHLVQACAQLAETLLHFCPDLRILATSREALGISGETVYLVPTLTTPNPVHATLDTLSDYEAVQLFVERAQTVMPSFSITSDNAPAIAQVCHHLDGIPLALELAAARVKLLRVEEIAARLDDRFRLLTGGTRTALPRHQTLQALIDWSHDLLTESERVLLRRLSVFAGGWTLEAVESVFGGEGIKKHEILDLLTQLVNKSLVVVERKQGEETRYRMLETIRQYAHEKLWGAGEGETLRQRQLAYFVDLAERAEPNLRAFDMIMWLDKLEAELDNIRVALEWAQESDVAAQLRLASALLWFWWIRGHRNEGIDWLERALSIEAIERGSKPLLPARAMLRAKACYAAGGCLMIGLGQMLEQGTRLLQESLALFHGLGSAGRRGMAYALRVLGWVAYLRGDPDRAKSLLEESRVLFHELGDKFGFAECLMNLGELALSQGDFSRARTLWEERLDVSKELGDKDGIAMSFGQLAGLAVQQGDYPRTISLRRESLALFHELGSKDSIAYQLEHMAYVVGAQSQEKRAVRLLGAAKVLRESMNSPIGGGGVIADEQAEYDHAVATARAALGEEEFAEVWAEGKAMTLEQAVAYALED